MEVNQDLSFLALLGDASFLVQCVMAILLGMSVVSWWYIFRKFYSFRDTREQAEEFEAGFVASSNLAMLYEKTLRSRDPSASLGRIFVSGFREFSKLRKRNHAPLSTSLMEGSRRAMRATYQREMDRLESNLSSWQRWDRSVHISVCSAPYGAL